MSKKSDLYELQVANQLNDIAGVSATRPKVSSKYSDVLVTYREKTAWFEVKMNHTDNLGNPRVSFDGERWTAAVESPITEYATARLNGSWVAHTFLDELRNHVGRSNIKVPTTKGGLKDPEAVTLAEMRSFFAGRTQYVISEDDVDLGALVTEHYLHGKAEPAHYMIAGGDIYQIGDADPFGLSLPKLSGRGKFRMRIGLRSQFYEVQPEIKIDELPYTQFTLEKHPFSVHEGVGII